ncbi:MAG: hypothetical protein V7K69_16505 [Nostoc sp.]|uniref:hypothetical protein n=1 Tax=Nostoc sp. TaxID=1180 RepID=UPI002FF74D9D
MSDTSRYGKYYWCIKVTKDLSKDGEIFVMADEVKSQKGVLFCTRKVVDDNSQEIKDQINLAIASGKWLAVYAASVMDGAAVAVEFWEGEVKRD